MGARIEFDTAIDRRVAASLQALASSQSPDLIVLPTRVRANGVWYAEGDLETLKMARSEGACVELLDDGPPTFLHEHSAGWYEEVAIGVVSGVSATTLTAFAAVIWRKARAAVGRGLHPGPDDQVPFRLSVTRLTQTRESTELTSCEVEGSAADVIGGLPEVARRLGLAAARPGDGSIDAVTPGSNAALPDPGQRGQLSPPSTSEAGARDTVDDAADPRPPQPGNP